MWGYQGGESDGSEEGGLFNGEGRVGGGAEGEGWDVRAQGQEVTLSAQGAP